MIFKKSDNALLFWLIVCDSFSKYNRTGVFNESEIGIAHVNNNNNNNNIYIYIYIYIYINKKN